MDYRETLDFLFTSLPMFQRVGGSAYKANLDNTHRLDTYFGHPHRKFLTIHVAGTNGKGSVSHLIAAVLQQAGYKTGLYTSPHLLDFRERIRINGAMIPEIEVVDFVEKHREIIREIQPSFFEMTVLMAFDYFARSEVDIAVIEVGMGGRLDSTNVIQPLVSVITNISFDHKQFLGDSLQKIAFEKAGIIKDEIPVVIGESQPETAPVFIQQAKQQHAPLLFADQLYQYLAAKPTPSGQQIRLKSRLDAYEFSLSLDLSGSYQHRNILTVLAALEVLNRSGRVRLSRLDIEVGLKHAAQSTGLQGRWQVLGESPRIIADTGHNEAGIREIVAQLQTLSYRRLYVVLGVVNDKELEGLWKHLPKVAYYFFTQAKIERAMAADKLAESAFQAGYSGEIVPDIPQALARARACATAEDLIFVGGSTFTVAEVL